MPEQLHVVVGAGSIGTGVTDLLVQAGHRVRLVTRSGSGPEHPQVERVAADATDADRLAGLATGATAIYNCVNPPYDRWAQDWPPLSQAFLTAAQRSGAVLATMSNLYLYGPVDAPMTESTPMAATGVKGRTRGGLWRDALAAHQAGRARVTEVRASDYLGLHSQSQLGDSAVARLRAGKPVRLLGDPDVVHTFTWTRDAARMLVVAAADERAWGRPWHVPSHPARTARDLVEELCRLAGVPVVGVRRLPRFAITLAAPFVPFLRELPEVLHQHTRPFVLDSSAARQTFGLEPSPWEEILRDVLGNVPGDVLGEPAADGSSPSVRVDGRSTRSRG